jgi:hypothetical protein
VGKRKWLAAGALAALVSVGSAGAEPGWGDLGFVGGQRQDEIARDDLDALERGLPGGSPELEEWYADWTPELRELREKGVDSNPNEAAEDLFGGFFGEPAWRASRNQRVVLSALRDLSPPGTGARRDLLEQMLTALSRYATDSSRIRGQAPRPQLNQRELTARMMQLAEQRRIDEDSLRALGISVWDYKAAALTLLTFVEPRRTSSDDRALEALLDSPPEPGGDGGVADMLGMVKERLRESEGDVANQLKVQVEDLERLNRRRERAVSKLREQLGDAAMTSGPLLAATLREAFLDLGRVETELIRFEEAASLPVPAEVDISSDGRLFHRMNADSLGERLGKELLDADLKISAKLFDLDLVPGVSISGKYKWEIEDAARSDAVERTDEWELKGKVGIGDLIEDVFETPFSVNLSHGRKILLVRQFPDRKSAAKPLPKTPFKLPFTAERARELPMGWFWSLPVDMAAVATLSFGYGEGLVNARIYGNYLLRGRFRMNIFKEAEDKVRVQIIGGRERGPGGGAEVKLGGFDLFGVRILDKALERLVDLRVLRIERARRRGVGVAIDYVYDLDDAGAAGAYEAAVRATLGFSGILAANPVVRAENLQDRMLQDLRPTEKLFLEDRERPVDERRVDRRFLATNVFKYHDKRYRIGPRLARYGRNSRWIENRLEVTHADESVDRFQFPIYQHWRGWSLLFGLWKESGEIQAFSLMQVPDGAREPTGPQPLIMKASLRDRRASHEEVLDVRQLAVRSLGPFLSSRLQLHNASIPSGGKSLRTHILVALHPAATARIMDPARTSDAAIVEAAVKAVLAGRGPSAPRTPQVLAEAEDLAEPLLLAREIPGEPGNAAQVRALVRLAELPEWRRTGVRFLVEILGDNPSTSEVHVDVAWSGKGIEPVDRRYGQPQHEDLYRIVSEALSAVSDRDRPFGD